MFKLDVYFRNIELSITFNYKNSINAFGDMLLNTPQKHENYQKASFNLAERCWMLYVPI